jgi:hypothetical protein
MGPCHDDARPKILCSLCNAVPVGQFGARSKIEVVDDPLRLRGPLAEICGGGLQGGNTCITLVMVMLDSEML